MSKENHIWNKDEIIKTTNPLGFQNKQKPKKPLLSIKQKLAQYQDQLKNSK